MILSPQKYVSNHQNKAKFKNLDFILPSMYVLLYDIFFKKFISVQNIHTSVGSVTNYT